MKRLSCVVLATLGLSLAACGDDGGGGNQGAFCDELDALAEEVSDGELASDDGLEDVTATLNSLFEAADEGDQADAVEAVGNEVQSAEAEDAADTFETIDDELGDFADDCDVELEEPDAPETTTTTEPETTTTDTTEPPVTDTTGGEPPADAILVNARQPVPPETPPEFVAGAQACFDGDMAACDTLFTQTDIDTPEEAYGETCGGRLTEARPGECQNLVTAPIPVPADVVDQATAAACFGGDMVACDTLFQGAAADSIDEAYGALCGGRVQNTQALCVDIFGEVAFQ